MLKVLYHRAKFGGARISHATAAAKNVEFFVCLCVCLFVPLVSFRVCAHHFAKKTLEYTETIPILLDRGMLVVVHMHPCSTFSDCCHLAISQYAAEVQKRQNFGFFAARGRQNKRIETKFGR